MVIPWFLCGFLLCISVLLVLKLYLMKKDLWYDSIMSEMHHTFLLGKLIMTRRCRDDREPNQTIPRQSGDDPG